MQQDVDTQDRVNVVWAPQEGPQTAFVHCPIEEIMFGGSRGGGKTDACLGFMAIKCQKYGRQHRGIFFRRELPQLDAVISRSQEIFAPLGAVYKESTKTWTFPNGATVRFRHLDRDSDHQKYQGHNYQCVGVGTLVLMADGTHRPIERITVGDLVHTLEGPKRVQGTLAPYRAECVELRVLDRAGRVLSRQIQPTTHPVLTSVLSRSSPSRDCSQTDVPQRLDPAPWKSALPHPDNGLGRRGASSWSEGVAKTDTSERQTPPEARPLAPSIVQVALHSPLRQSSAESSHTSPMQSRDPCRSASRDAGGCREGTTVPALDPGQSYGCDRPGLLALDPLAVYADVQPPFYGELTDQKSTRDFRGDCLTCSSSGDEPPHLGSTLDQSPAPSQGGAGTPNHAGPALDGTDCIPSHSHGRYGSYIHPYTAELRPLEDQVELGRAEVLFVGEAWVCDISVEDANHYITSSKLINSNTICWEELTQFPDPKPIMKLKATLRSAHGVPCQMIASANPGGPGHSWVKKRFIDPNPLGWSPIRTKSKTGKIRERVYIPSRVYDNKLLLDNDPDYPDRIADSANGDEALEKAWLDGVWDIVEGAYFGEWDTRKHVIKNCDLPDHWLRFRCGDWGSAKPFAFYWAAVASETWIAPGGKMIPKGAVVFYREYYGVKLDKDGDFKPNVGLKLYAEEVGRNLLEIERHMPPIMYGVIDPSAMGSDGGPSIAERIARGAAAAGGKMFFRHADNKRVPGKGAMGGWDQMRARLKGEDFGDGTRRPMVYFTEQCIHAIRTIPMLQHDADNIEDVDTDGEDHPADAIRYGLMSRPWTAPTPERMKPVQGIESVNLNQLWAQQQAEFDREQSFGARI